MSDPWNMFSVSCTTLIRVTVVTSGNGSGIVPGISVNTVNSIGFVLIDYTAHCSSAGPITVHLNTTLSPIHTPVPSWLEFK